MEFALPVQYRDVGGDRDPWPVAVVAGGRDRRDADFPADGADHRAGFCAGDRGRAPDPPVRPGVDRGIDLCGAVLRAARPCLAASERDDRDRLADAAQSVRPDRRALFGARGQLCDDPRSRGDDRGRRDRDRADAAARRHRVRPGDVERDGVLRIAAAIRHQLRHDRADRGGDGADLWLRPDAVAASNGVSERRDRRDARRARGAAGVVATPDRVREFRQHLCAPGGDRSVRRERADQPARP